MIITRHAARRLAERGVSIEEVEEIIRRPLNIDAGDMGNVVLRGQTGGRHLCVVLSPDRLRLVSAWEVSNQ